MYIIIFDDGAIRKIEEINHDCLVAFELNHINIIDTDKMKILEKVVGDELLWVDIERI